MGSSVSGAAYRWAAVFAVLAAAGGWGAFFHVSERAAATEQAQSRELRELKQGRAELQQAMESQRAKLAETKELEMQLQVARQNLDRTREAQEKAQGTLAAMQGEISNRRAELSTAAQQLAQLRQEQTRAEQAAAEQTASVEKAKPRKRQVRKAKRAKRVAKRT
jgi:hypothetical protein